MAGPSGVELTTLLKDITKKQELAEALQQTLENHQKAIRTLGAESIELQKKQEEFENFNVEAQREIAAFTAKSMLSKEQVHKADHDTLAMAHATLAQRLVLVREQNRESISRIQKLQNELIEQNELNIKIEALQNAHQAQQAYLASIRSRLKSTMADKREVVRNQKAIAELERLVDEVSRLGTDTSDTPIESPPFALLCADNAAIRAAIEETKKKAIALEKIQGIGSDVTALQKQLEEATQRCNELAEHNLVLRRRANGGVSEVDQNERIGPTSAESGAIERQKELLELSKDNASKELALEMKILEAKSIASHGFSSAAAFVLNQSGSPRISEFHEVVPTDVAYSRKGEITPSHVGRSSAHSTTTDGRHRTPPSRLEPLNFS